MLNESESISSSTGRFRAMQCRVRTSRATSPAVFVPLKEPFTMRTSHGRRGTFLILLLLFVSSAYAQPNNYTSKRVVYYVANMNNITLLPLISKENLDKQGKPYTTDILLGEWHLGPEPDTPNFTWIRLNSAPPNNSMFDTLWKDTAILQSKGININLFLGGYGDQSFVNLAKNFSYYYPILKETIQTYKLNGIDLDVEDSKETTEQMVQLIKQLRSDFGHRFIITLAPVVTDMLGEGGLSLIDYVQLYKELGSNISWFNVQFYSGFGTLATPSDYMAVIKNGFPPNIIVAGMLSNLNGGGFVNLTIVEQTVKSLVKKFPDFGGVVAWEYFNSLPGGTADPSQWGTVFGKVMGGH